MSTLFRYSIYYFFMSSSVAVGLSFLPVYCNHLGLSPFHIALVSAGLNLGTVLGSPLMAHLAHRYFSAQSLVTFGLWTAFLASLPIVNSTSFLSLYPFWQALALLAYGSAVIVDYHAVRESISGRMRFEHARLWGSVGFIATVSLLGLCLDHIGVRSIPVVLAVISLLAAISGTALRPLLSKHPAEQLRKPQREARIETTRAFYCLLATVALVWASHSAMYIYLSIHLRALGWSGTLVSFAWSVGVLAEILVFLMFRRIEYWLSVTRILQLSVFFTALRWIILASVESEALILLSQLLHGLTFGSLYLASVRLVHVLLPEEKRDQGQSLLSAFSSGVGSLSGRITIGALASTLAMPEAIPALFAISAIPAALALALSFRIHLPTKRPSLL